LKNTILNNQWVIKEIRRGRGMKIFLEPNKSRNMIYQNL
jgi:hypothetical protein